MSKQKYTFEELRETAAKYGIEVQPPPAQKGQNKRSDPGVSSLKKAISKRQKGKQKTAAPAPRDLPKTETHYIDAKGREYVNGEWVERSPDHWQRQARRGGFAKVIEVYDVPGPTVTEHRVYGRIVQRGCLICGLRDVARPPRPIRFGRLRGSMCVKCHIAWEALSTNEKRQLALFTFRRLDDENRLPPDFPRADKVLFGEHRINHYSANWKRYVWAVRVLRSDHPEVQEPVSTPFGFLAPGPIAWAEKVDAEVSQ